MKRLSPSNDFLGATVSNSTFMKFTHLLLSFLVFIIFTSAAHAWEGPFFDKTSSEYSCDNIWGAEVTFRKTDKVCNKHVFYENDVGVTLTYNTTSRNDTQMYDSDVFYPPGELCAFIRHSRVPDAFDSYILLYHYRKYPEESCSATVSDKALEAPCTTVSDKASEDPCTTASDKYPREIPTTFQAQHPLQTGLKKEDKLKVYVIKLSSNKKQFSCSELKDEFPQFLIYILRDLKLTTK